MEVPEAKTLEAKDAASPGQIRGRNRALLLAAAEEVFATQGYRGATTAAIAKKAGLPKANVHYYFGTKEALYAAVLEDILGLWLGELDRITEERDPATALGDYIRAKVRLSRERPLASKVYADRKSTRLNSSHSCAYRMPSSA